MAIQYKKPVFGTPHIVQPEIDNPTLRRIVDSLVVTQPNRAGKTMKLIEEITAKTGRPSSGKVVVSIRLDPDVVEKFKATGKGWQSRINDVLRAAKL